MFLALESPYFCNKYLRTIPEDTGLVTLSSFLLFWGWVFIISTTFVALFKHEANDTANTKESQVKGINDIVNAYKQLLTIVKLPAVRTLALVLFTAKVRDLHFFNHFKTLIYNSSFKVKKALC